MSDILKENTDKILKTSTEIRKFIKTLFDSDSFVETDVFLNGGSFLGEGTAFGEGVVTGYALINEIPVNFFAQNSEVLKGGFGGNQAKKIIKTLNRAKQSGTPFLGIMDCSGFRIDEDVKAIEAYSFLIKELSVDTEIPTICIIKGNNIGLMKVLSGIFDFVIISDKAVSALNAPMKLAKGSDKFSDLFGCSFNTETGFADFVYKSASDLKSLLINLLSITENAQIDNDDDPNRVVAALNKNHNPNKTAEAVFDNGKCLMYKDGFGKEVHCGFGSINGFTACFMAVDTNQNKLTLQDLYKLKRFVEIADKFSLPLISFVDSDNVDFMVEDEKAFAAGLSSNLLKTIAKSTMPKISVICNKAIGFSYSAFVSKNIGFDFVLAFSDSIISPIASETAINMYFEDDLKNKGNSSELRKKLISEYNKTFANPFEKAKEGFIDNIIEPSSVRPYIAQALMMLLGV